MKDQGGRLNSESSVAPDQEDSNSEQATRLHPSAFLLPSTLRLFCAIELSAAARERLSRYGKQVREMASTVRASWVREENLHLTIKFIGEVSSAKAGNLSAAAARAAAGLSPFAIELEGTGAFPRHGPPKVLWIGIEDASGGLASLHDRLDEECAREGFSRDDRAFHPHLTIARLRSTSGARELVRIHQSLGFPRSSVMIDELLVIRSELSSNGSNYTVLSRHRLRD